MTTEQSSGLQLDLTAAEQRDKVVAAIRNLASQRLDSEIAASANLHDGTLPPHKPLPLDIERKLQPGTRIICPGCNHAEMAEQLAASIEALKQKYAALLSS